ncbi:MAG TPA: hypothetical protein VMX18_02845 [Candidatus Bipolaricaulota bacterium]|nr:hypothetical protein [Candidatus Bipolaricaulota bacterium]
MVIKRISWTKRSWLLGDEISRPDDWTLTILFEPTKRTLWRKAVEMITAIRIGRIIWKGLTVEFLGLVKGEHHVYFDCGEPPTGLPDEPIGGDGNVPVKLYFENPSLSDPVTVTLGGRKQP